MSAETATAMVVAVSKQAQTDIVYLKMALDWSSMSVAIRFKVGALIVKDGQIISHGHNGTPAGFPNECELSDGKPLSRHELLLKHYAGEPLVTKREVLHAESNAITKVARTTSSCEGATLYCTDSCCFECAKLIIQAGIKRFVYHREYRITDGLDLLREAGIEVVRYDKLED